MLTRHASDRIEEAPKDTRIVTLEVPRQAGKSILCGVIAAAHGMSSVTLDESSVREAAQRDPTGFIAELGTPVFIDEVQRPPDLVLALRESVDRDPRPGRYLVIGSANLLLLPTIGDSSPGASSAFHCTRSPKLKSSSLESHRGSANSGPGARSHRFRPTPWAAAGRRSGSSAAGFQRS
jgi:predicted AAA+ superfamily ATPase